MHATFLTPGLTATSQVELINPAKAEELLKQNTSNRRLNDAVVAHYANQMSNGTWPFTGHPIVIGISGRLLDGQHRLKAIIKANVSIPMLVVRGIENEADAFDAIDTGKLRSSGDVLSAKGYKQSHALAAIARVIIRYERLGLESVSSKNRLGGTTIKQRGLIVTNHDVVSYVEANPDIYEIVSISESLYSRSNRYLSPTEFAILYYIFSKIDTDMAIEFLTKLATGVDLKDKNPIYVIRRKMDLMAKVNNSIVDKRQKMYLCVRAWNDYRSGKEVGQYQYNRDTPFHNPI